MAEEDGQPKKVRRMEEENWRVKGEGASTRREERVSQSLGHLNWLT